MTYLEILRLKLNKNTLHSNNQISSINTLKSRCIAIPRDNTELTAVTNVKPARISKAAQEISFLKAKPVDRVCSLGSHKSIGTIPTFELVLTFAAIDDVISASSLKLVFATAALENIFSETSNQRICPISAKKTVIALLTVKNIIS